MFVDVLCDCVLEVCCNVGYMELVWIGLIEMVKRVWDVIVGIGCVEMVGDKFNGFYCMMVQQEKELVEVCVKGYNMVQFEVVFNVNWLCLQQYNDVVVVDVKKVVDQVVKQCVEDDKIGVWVLIDVLMKSVWLCWQICDDDLKKFKFDVEKVGLLVEEYVKGVVVINEKYKDKMLKVVIEDVGVCMLENLCKIGVVLVVQQVVEDQFIVGQKVCVEFEQ